MMEFGLLGPVQVWTAGRAVGGGQPRQRLVLAGLLADAGQLVTSEQLVDRVWGQIPPAGARRALHSHIARVRKLLALAAGPGQEQVSLIHHSGGYVLDIDPDRVDVHRFRRLVTRAGEPGCADIERVGLLRKAVGLWRGEPLAGLPGQWAARVRGGWHRQRTQAVVAWANAELSAGTADAVIGPLTDIVGEYPLVEPLTAVLMRALYAAGRSAEALACYRAARTSLVNELGAEPGAELRDVHRAVLRGDLDGPAPMGAVGTARISERPVIRLASPPVGELVSTSLVELAVHRLRDEILSGRAVSGERLVEEQLTRRLGVSRAPLREALRLLGEQGLVEHIPRRGARVAVLSLRDVEELYAVRGVLERHVAATVQPIADPAGLAGMREGLANMAAAVSSGDRVAAAYAHRGFHVALAALAGNRQLSTMYESVLMKLQLYLAVSGRGSDGSAGAAHGVDGVDGVDGVGRHGRLLRAVESGDRELTRHELQSHSLPATHSPDR